MNSEKIESHRLIIRPFIDNDLLVIHRILDRPFGDGTKDHDQTALEERRMWLQWQILNQEWLPKTDQPPLGEQAIVLKATRNVIGSTGLVPYIEPFEQIPEFRTLTAPNGTIPSRLVYSGSSIRSISGRVMLPKPQRR